MLNACKVILVAPPRFARDREAMQKAHTPPLDPKERVGSYSGERQS
jgi:hypothetical protein